MAHIPLMVELKEKQVAIVGGGIIAAKRIGAMLESCAKITVISPTINQVIRRAWEAGLLTWRQKTFEATDIQQAVLVIAATNNQLVNQSVCQSAPAGCLVNNASDAEESHVHFPAHLKQGRLSISISTNEASPTLAAKIKQELESIYNKDYEGYVEFLYQCRQLLKQSTLGKQQQKKQLQALVSDEFLCKDKQLEALQALRQLAGMDASEAKGFC
ncbi:MULTISPECIES: NAD(P)-binding protein [Clostridia]|uniref:NAD(P)-binding protein n=1 Tax=Clostridia TaxID=186801 RepID=UPI000EA35EEE|nr:MULTISPECIES: NAD(P)-binding protein [Clostridia]NBJ69836.1 NAD(P)-binding protein [Roseburia sp. 1XD42-34]RKI77907.1 NAD(P)-binding protein [Clostridium sp. 1xD42-85]